MLIRAWAHWKAQRSKELSSSTQDSSQSPEGEATEKPENLVEAWSICKGHVLKHDSLPGQEPQAPGCIKAEVLEAKLDEKGVPGMKPVVGKKGKKIAGVQEQKKPLVGEKAAATRKPAAEKPLAEKKPTVEEKKPMA